MRTTRNLTISLPPAMLRDMERVAKRENRTLSELVRESFRRYPRQPGFDVYETIVVRTSPDRMALTAWLVKQLDRPPSSPSVTAQYTLPSGPENIVGVFYLPNPTRERLTEAAVQVRTTAPAQRLFTYSALGALAVRGTVGQVARAEKVIDEMRTAQ